MSLLVDFVNGFCGQCLPIDRKIRLQNPPTRTVFSRNGNYKQSLIRQSAFPGIRTKVSFSFFWEHAGKGAILCMVFPSVARVFALCQSGAMRCESGTVSGSVQCGRHIARELRCDPAGYGRRGCTVVSVFFAHAFIPSLFGRIQLKTVPHQKNPFCVQCRFQGATSFQQNIF